MKAATPNERMCLQNCFDKANEAVASGPPLKIPHSFISLYMFF